VVVIFKVVNENDQFVDVKLFKSLTSLLHHLADNRGSDDDNKLCKHISNEPDINIATVLVFLT
jgi:hypothetical protein